MLSRLSDTALFTGVRINMQHYWCRCTHHTELNIRTAGSHCAYYRCLNEWVPVGWSCMSCGFHSAPLGSLHSFCFYPFPTPVLWSIQLPSPDLTAPLKCIPAPWFHGTRQKSPATLLCCPLLLTEWTNREHKLSPKEQCSLYIFSSRNPRFIWGCFVGAFFNIDFC